jgi:outer membrane protein OmpA-like peptidoglycan-associated protein
MKFMSKRILLACFLMVSIFAWGQETDEVEFETVDMNFVFNRANSASFPVLYAVPDVVYVPFQQLFDFLKIPNTLSSDGKKISGFFETASNGFLIDMANKSAVFAGKTIPLNDSDTKMDMGILYVRTGLLKRVFGFDVTLNARALAIQFDSPFELPLFKLLKLEKKRSGLGSLENDDVVFDTIMKRDYHWYRGQMLDWAIASSQTDNEVTDTRFALGTGAEVLGGETNIFLNYSTSIGMPRNQQQYSWRWADNDFKLVRQVRLGRINTQTIASLLAPVDGFNLTNARTTIRKALGYYRIAETTEPNWTVELYLNNQMVSYTRADASGFFSFKVPIVYGTSEITLRFYGPNGEIRSEEKTFNMPFNLLPKGELEYSISGGSVLDTTGTKMGVARFNYGLSRGLTMGWGVEYLSSIARHPEIPYLNFTFQPISKILITGEYAHWVRSKVSVNAMLPGNIVLDGTYAKYDPNQDAIVYNYKEERMMGLSIPFRLRNISNSFRAAVRQNVYEDFSYLSGEASLTTSYQGYSLIYANYFNNSATRTMNYYGNLTLATKFMGANLRASAQYNYSFNKLLTVRMEMDRRVTKSSYAALRLEDNFMTNSKNVSLAFRYELPFMNASASSSYGNRKWQWMEALSGSFAFNSGNKYVYTDNKGNVGKSGIALIPFVDMNFNGKKEANEPYSKGLRIRCSGGQVLNRENDTIIRVVGLEPFVDYTLILDESGFDNVALQLNRKNIKVISDPNQFKRIPIPVLPMGEISGMVTDENGKGIGRILVRMTDAKDSLIAKVLTESDGYFNYIGFKPGKYRIGVDTMQLRVLNYEADPLYGVIHENPDGDVLDAGVITLNSKNPPSQPKPQLVITSVPQQPIEDDTLALFTVFFAVDKTHVRSEYLEPLKMLAAYLNKPEHEQLGIDIQGHTDSDASVAYNLVLSNRRAEAVKKILVGYGVRADRLKTSAFGKDRSLNANRSRSEKSVNRRVVFRPIYAYEPAERSFEEVIGLRNLTDLYAAPKDTKPTPSVYKLPATKEIRIVTRKGDTQTVLLPDVPIRSKNGRSMTPYLDGKVLYPGAPSWCLLFRQKNQYLIQVVVYNSRKQAMLTAEKLRKVIPDRIMVVSEGGKVKVQLGYYDTPEEALRDARLMHSKGLIK